MKVFSETPRDSGFVCPVCLTAGRDQCKTHREKKN
jgi:hypothetical protein